MFFSFRSEDLSHLPTQEICFSEWTWFDTRIKKKYSPGKKMKFTHFHQRSSHKQNYLDLTWKKITLEKMYVTAPQDFQDVIIRVKTSCCFFLSEHFDDKFVISLLKKLHCNITDWFHLIPLMINSLKHGCSSHFNTFECL